LDKKALIYQGKVIFEKFSSPKFNRIHRANVLNEGCFVFLDKGEFTVRSQTELIKFNTNNALLAKCTNYFYELDYNQQKRIDNIQIIAVFFHKPIIEEIYNLDILHQTPVNKKTIRSIILDPLLKHFKESINHLLDNPETVDEDLILFKLRELVQLLLRAEKGTSVIDFFTSMFNPLENDMKSIIEKNVYSSLSLEDFANLCNMSISSFQRKFKKVYSDSLGKYILDKKIQRAEQLLTKSNKSITEISFECGFETISSLNRNFKSKVKMSPSSFRIKNS